MSIVALLLLLSSGSGCVKVPNWRQLDVQVGDRLAYIGEARLERGSYCLYDYRHFWSGRETARLVVASRHGELLGYYAFPIRFYGKVKGRKIFVTNIDGEDEVIEFEDNSGGLPSSLYFDGDNFRFNRIDGNSLGHHK